MFKQYDSTSLMNSTIDGSNGSPTLEDLFYFSGRFKKDKLRIGFINTKHFGDRKYDVIHNGSRHSDGFHVLGDTVGSNVEMSELY